MLINVILNQGQVNKMKKKNCILLYNLESVFTYGSSIVFEITAGYQVQEPIQGTPSPFKVWTFELTVLEIMQVSPGPAQISFAIFSDAFYFEKKKTPLTLPHGGKDCHTSGGG